MKIYNQFMINLSKQHFYNRQNYLIQFQEKQTKFYSNQKQGSRMYKKQLTLNTNFNQQNTNHFENHFVQNKSSYQSNNKHCRGSLINQSNNISRINRKKKLTLSQIFQDFQNIKAEVILSIQSESINIQTYPQNDSVFYQQKYKPHGKNQRAIPFVFRQRQNKKFNKQRNHQSQPLNYFNNHEKQNYFLNLPQKANNHQPDFQNQELFIFKVKDHKSNRKNSLLNALQSYQRSTSRSHSSNSKSKNGILSHSPKNSHRAIKSQIRMSPINPKLILQNLSTYRNTNLSEESFQTAQQFQNFNQTQDKKGFVLNNYQKKLNLKDQKNNFNQKKQKLLNKGNNFSFDLEFNDFNKNILSCQKPKIDFQYQDSNCFTRQKQLHTIQEVQQSIRSIQLPQNQCFDDELTKKINQHFEQIKQNMLKQLVMRSKNSKNGIDQASMESIVQQLHMAADQIVKKYQASFQKNNSLKKSDKLKSLSHQNNFNQPYNPIEPDIYGSDQNCINKFSVHRKGKVQSFSKYQLEKQQQQKVQKTHALQKLFENFDHFQQHNSENLKLNKSKQFNEFMKKGLITNQIQKSSKDFQDKQKNNQVLIKIINDSFSTLQNNLNKAGKNNYFTENTENKKKVEQLTVLNQALKYQECSKGDSSISSINSNIQEKNQQDIKENQNNPNKDSMKAQVQSLNRYTFLKHHKDKPHNFDMISHNNKITENNSIQQMPKNVYTYRQKELDQSEYKIIEDHKANQQIYTVKYNLKILNSQQVKKQQNNSNFNFQKYTENFNEKKSQVEVFRLSPLKFRRKQQVVQQMVKAKMIQKQSESFLK